MKTILMKNFSRNLICRNKYQGSDLDVNAEMFRIKHLAELDDQTWWDGEEKITLEFEGVDTISPGFANEAFAYFGIYKNVTWNKFKQKVILKNISEVKYEIIRDEVKSGTGEDED